MITSKALLVDPLSGTTALYDVCADSRLVTVDAGGEIVVQGPEPSARERRATVAMRDPGGPLQEYVDLMEPRMLVQAAAGNLLFVPGHGQTGHGGLFLNLEELKLYFEVALDLELRRFMAVRVNHPCYGASEKLPAGLYLALPDPEMLGRVALDVGGGRVGLIVYNCAAVVPVLVTV